MDMILDEEYKTIVAEIARLQWTSLDEQDLLAVALAYYYFSVQFRENLVEACGLYPDDEMLQKLLAGECDTDNLSPWPSVALPGERMHHDEFMRRSLELSPIDPETRAVVEAAGASYLQRVRSQPPESKARSISSYENGGLERTFRAMLTAPHWRLPGLLAFRHFLVEHIRFDNDPDEGHAALSRHLVIDDRVLPFWIEFRDLLVCAAPRLARRTAQAA
jgi:hypothetical protein